MKIIEALKLSKELLKKAEDLRVKIANHSAHLSVETPVYPDQKAQVSSWLQAHEDITREVAALHVRIAKTNLATSVTIEIDGNKLTKSITEWVYRRRTLAPLDADAWAKLTDRGLRENQVVPSTTPGGASTPIKIVRCYDPVQRDAKRGVYQSEPGVIDRTLEVTNATVDLLD